MVEDSVEGFIEYIRNDDDLAEEFKDAIREGVVEDDDLADFFKNDKSVEKNFYHYLKLEAQKENFLSILNQNAANNFLELGINRKTLDSHHAFESQGAVDFLSNLRVSNRSQKRLTKQLGDYVARGEMERVGKYESYRSWSFDGGVKALEVQQITSEGRMDEVSNMGSYATVYEHIENLKKFLKEDDAFIATQCRNIISGKGIDKKITNPVLRQTIVSLTYLLFGTEASRNPGQLIAAQMALDLIIESGDADDSWEMAIDDDDMNKKAVTKSGEEKKETNGGYIPMTMKEALKAVRGLYGYYSEHFAFPYKYDNDSGNKSQTRSLDLIEREAEIFDRWIKLKQDKKELPEKFRDEDLVGLIRNQQEKWYGVSFPVAVEKLQVEVVKKPVSKTK